MNSSKLIRQLSSHFLALAIGVGITFSGIKMLSSGAETLPEKSLTNNASPPVVAQANNSSSSKTSRSFVSAAIERTGAAVVRIDTQKTVANRIDPVFEDPFFREFFGDRLPQQMPRERQVRGQGSGFITNKDGTILTNAHVVSDADTDGVMVTLKDGRKFPGKVMGTDEVTDLAVVKIDAKGADLPVAPLGDSSQLEVGDWAIAVGNPIGLNNTVTLGIISTLDRSSAQVGIGDKRIDFLQTDAAINPGNSGGPLLNDSGEVIGINTAIRPDANGIGFAIPINKAKSIEPTLAAGKKVAHPYIGIQMLTLTPELAKENNQDPNSTVLLPEIDGVLVMQVMPNTPAERGGIRRGDVILEIDGTKVTNASQLQNIVENSGVDRNLKFKVQRGDRSLNLEIKTAQLENVSSTELK